MTQNRSWFFAIDRGGTFTDVIGYDPYGCIHTLKLLSKSSKYDDASIEGVRRMLGLKPGEPVPGERVSEIRMGTTVATNALLERKGAPAALFVTEGFGDLLEIGYQNRPDIFALEIEKPGQLYKEVREIGQRMNAAGETVKPLDLDAVRKNLRDVYKSGIRSIAVAFLHSWVNPEDEKSVGKVARETGFTQVSLSHESMRRIKIVGRAQTTMVDAYLSPALAEYVESVKTQTGDIPISFMQSSGGLADALDFSGKDAVLSGPAGGVIAVAEETRTLNAAESIGFDMGGTSTDVCRFGGEPERSYENHTGGISFQADMLSIETVASGGGSILGFEGQRMTVGPESAGANPGPACYGKGGPLTVTDANLILGRIDPGNFPKSFGASEDKAIDEDAARQKFERLTEEINEALDLTMTPEDTALGYIRIANEIMAKPIKSISIARGFDIRRHTLIAFGGAGGLHACAIAKILGMGNVVVHPLAGLFSAYGIGLARHRLHAERSLVKAMSEEVYASLAGVEEEMAAPLKDKLSRGANRDELETSRSLDLRPIGSDGYLTIRDDGYDASLEKFSKSFMARFGFEPNVKELEIVNVRVEVSAKERSRGFSALEFDGEAALPWAAEIYFEGGPEETKVVDIRSLKPGDEIAAPALITGGHCTILIEQGFGAAMDGEGRIVMERISGAESVVEIETAQTADPVLLEVFNHAFTSVAEQMGETLIKTAHSVNMKERLDFSCAVFDKRGGLIANAPHIPVHLGAMGESVKEIIKRNEGKLKQGQAWVTNHPGKGGSHLPDVTVVTPVFVTGDDKPDFFVATRGHHADIGGKAPGSMSPFSTTLAEEGVVLDNVLLAEDEKFNEELITKHLTEGPYPARDIRERISDLTAQAAANHKGELELERLSEKYGIGVVKAYMGHIQANAAHSLRQALGRFLEGREIFESSFFDHMDGGAEIKVTIKIEKGDDPPFSHKAQIDFAGSSPQQNNSLNAPLPVTRAAVIYVLRLLVERDIPLNDGLMECVELLTPEGSMLNPGPEAAVVGGNVETSQRIVDVLLGALGVAGASQGTMNNLAIGFSREDGASFGGRYYETIAGGAGAVDGADGADAVQVHMTNTRITDPEVFELRFPGARIKKFAIRKNSGGAGIFRGGDGVIREFEFVEPCRVTIFSERREYAPYGMNGGGAGERGVNTLFSGGVETLLGGRVMTDVKLGDILRIETPGGGGYGKNL